MLAHSSGELSLLMKLQYKVKGGGRFSRGHESRCELWYVLGSTAKTVWMVKQLELSASKASTLQASCAGAVNHMHIVPAQPHLRSMWRMLSVLTTVVMPSRLACRQHIHSHTSNGAVVIM